MSLRTFRVKNAIKKRAIGICEACENPITFLDIDGEPFIITHHIIPICDGGSDDEYNTAGICSICHDRIHYGKDGKEYNEILKRKIIEKQTKIDREKNYRKELRGRSTLESKINSDLESRRNTREKERKKLEIRKEVVKENEKRDDKNNFRTFRKYNPLKF